MPIITLMTDFGIKDGNVGVIKGVIWSICPDAKIADLSHLIHPQAVQEAALLTLRSAPYFPENTVHVIVVDPGVGTIRRPLAAQIGKQRYVCPDNGVLTMILERAEREGWPVEFVHLDKSKYWLPTVSCVFHGRDIFAPSAAYFARGVLLNELGSNITDPFRLNIPQPQRTENSLVGEVIYIDHFGNISSNIQEEHLGKSLDNKTAITVKLGGKEIHGMVDTFGARPVGTLIALIGSTGNLIVSLVNGDAATYLKTKIGDKIKVIFNR